VGLIFVSGPVDFDELDPVLDFDEFDPLLDLLVASDLLGVLLEPPVLHSMFFAAIAAFSARRVSSTALSLGTSVATLTFLAASRAV
jgi:hypothetical protein